MTATFGLDHLILPFRGVKSGRVIYPDGTWSGMYTSVEIKNAINYGYKFEILSGYIFKSEDLFSTYVHSCYEMKENSTKGSAMYTISKLLLNSLYGLFGRKQEIIESVTINKSDIHKYILTNIIKTVIDIDENSILIKNIEIK